MKKLLLILITFFCFSFAQAQHAKIAGVPIDGTINTFQTRITAKGYKLSNLNSKVGVGRRVFSGTFMGEKALLFVSYDTKTKLVYRVMVSFDNTYDEEDAAEFKVNSIVDKISKKYGSLPFDRDGAEKEYFLKAIGIDGGFAYVWAYQAESYGEYMIKIQYDDDVNLEKHNNSISDDL